MIRIRLTPMEIAVAAHVGSSRRIASRMNQQIVDRDHSGVGSFQSDINAAAAEMAAAKAVGAYWEPTINTFKKPDIGKNIQVRSSENDDFNLIVRPDDSDSDVFVLVTGKDFDFSVWGYMNGKAAKQERWLKAPRERPPAYFVPKSELFNVIGGRCVPDLE